MVSVCRADDLAKYKQTFESETEEIVLTHGVNLARIGGEYTNLLHSLLASAKQAGDLDKTKTVLAEIERFRMEKAMPKALPESTEIRAVQTLYTRQASILEGEKARKFITLVQRYDSALLGIQKKLTTAGRLDEATAVQNERKRVIESPELVSSRAFLAGSTTTVSRTEGPVSHVPLQSDFKPKTYIDETRGFAGNPVENNNVYTFNVEKVGRRATLSFWASGDVGTMTYGNVTLTPPGKEGQLVVSWKPKDFKVAASSVTTYEKLKAISCDVSKYVKEPGPHKVTFKWTSGTVGLSILRVELDIK